MGNISTSHNHATIPTMSGAAAVTEGMHCAPHRATTAAQAALCLMDCPIATYAMTHPTGMVALHLKLATSPTDITHATIPQTVACLTPATLTTLNEDCSL